MFFYLPHCRKAPFRRRFTLIELLIVIGVTAALAAMLAPVLHSAKQSAMTVQCAGNLRILGTALMLYCADNGDRPVQMDADPVNYERKMWFGSRDSLNEPFRREGGITGYIPGRSSYLRCPAMPEEYDRRGDTGFGSVNAGCGGYGYNSVLGYRDITLGRIFDPAGTLAFADCLSVTAGGRLIEYYLAQAPRGETVWNGRTYFYDASPTINFRHLRRYAGVCWFDGHVTKEAMGYSSAGVESLHRIGWFGKYDVNRPNRDFDGSAR